MATQIADAFSPLRTDCLAVHHGANRGIEWANCSARMFGRAWGPVAAAFDGDASRLAWMPAHCSAQMVGVKKLSDGTLMTETDRSGNALVDKLAKQAAAWDQVSKAKRNFINEQSLLLSCIAQWIGQSCVLANHFPLPGSPTGGKEMTFVILRGFRLASVNRGRNACLLLFLRLCPVTFPCVLVGPRFVVALSTKLELVSWPVV